MGTSSSDVKILSPIVCIGFMYVGMMWPVVQWDVDLWKGAFDGRDGDSLARKTENEAAEMTNASTAIAV